MGIKEFVSSDCKINPVCTRLEVLDLAGCSDLESDSIAMIGDTTASNLRHLNLQSWKKNFGVDYVLRENFK